MFVVTAPNTEPKALASGFARGGVARQSTRRDRVRLTNGSTLRPIDWERNHFIDVGSA
jgi:hypothetical protein